MRFAASAHRSIGWHVVWSVCMSLLSFLNHGNAPMSEAGHHNTTARQHDHTTTHNTTQRLNSSNRSSRFASSFGCCYRAASTESIMAVPSPLNMSNCGANATVSIESIVTRRGCGCSPDPLEICEAFDYINNDIKRYQRNMLYLMEGRVHFTSVNQSTGWHGSYRWSGDDMLELLFHFAGDERKLHPVLLRRIASDEYEGEDYKGRSIALRFRRCFAYCQDCQVWTEFHSRARRVIAMLVDNTPMHSPLEL